MITGIIALLLLVFGFVVTARAMYQRGYDTTFTTKEMWLVYVPLVVAVVLMVITIVKL